MLREKVLGDEDHGSYLKQLVFGGNRAESSS